MINYVANAQIQAKTNDEKLRMRSAAVAIDFYNGRQYEHMEKVIAYLYRYHNDDGWLSTPTSYQPCRP